MAVAHEGQPEKRICQVGKSRASIFQNDRFTYRLNAIAESGIGTVDHRFVQNTGCSIRELRVLRIVDDAPGISFQEIVNATHLERSLTSRLIRRLLAMGLIRRENSKQDGRRYRLFTTDAGKATRQLARKVSDQLEEILLAPLSSKELSELNARLDVIADWLSSPEYRARIDEFRLADEPNAPAKFDR